MNAFLFKPTQLRYLLSSLLLISVLLGCNIAQQDIYKGNFDAAITRLCKKLSKHPHNEDNILLLERAFTNAMTVDLKRIDQLRTQNSATGWVEINSIYQNIDVRQDQIRRVLPLHLDKAARDCSIQFIDVNAQLASSGKKAAEFYYKEAKQLLSNRNRLDARKAYADLLALNNYPHDYTDVLQLKAQAREEGINLVLFKMMNNSDAIMPAQLEKDLMTMTVNDLNEDWVVYHGKAVDGADYDYKVVCRVQHMIVGPEQQNEKSYTDSKQVQDGWEYILDSRGNVKKDSLGNDMKKPKMKTISCVVKEVHQFKQATMDGVLEYYSTNSNMLIKTMPVKGDGVFENTFAIAVGDQSALTKDSKLKLDRKPMPFPTNAELMLQAGATFKTVLHKAMMDNRSLVRN
jgi:hypothetical protein